MIHMTDASLRYRRLALALVGMLPLAAACASPCPALAPLTAHATEDDLELAIRATEAAIPDIYWHQTPEAWEAAKQRARSATAQGGTDDSLLRTLQILLYQVGEGHFDVRASDATLCRLRAGAQLPIDLLWRDDGLYLVRGYGDAADLVPGTDVLAINGQSHAELLEELYRASPHDGIIRTGVMRSEGTRYAALRWLLRGEETSFRLRLRDGKGAVQERVVHPIPHGDRPRPTTVASPLATLHWIDQRTAYLYVPTFSNKRYRAVGADFASTIQGIFDQLHAKGAERLVLDLRDNGGGSEPNESILFSYLIEQPIQKYASVRTRGNLLKVASPSGRVYQHRIYDDEELETVRPVGNDALERLNTPPEGLMTRWTISKPVYTGRLVVLAGGVTFSGGAELASLLYASRRGVFVGEEVGGTHAGNTSGYKWELTLPHSGIHLGIPLLQFRFSWPEVLRDRGVLPDCNLQPRVGERRQEQDEAYRVALALLEQPWTHPRGVHCPLAVPAQQSSRPNQP